MKVIGNAGSLLLAAGVLGGLALAPGTARAFECATNSVVTPETGDTNLPTNTLLWGYGQPGTRLRAPSGEVVATDERKLPIASSYGQAGVFPVLVPREPLEPNAEYTIEIDNSFKPEPDRVVFSTGAGPTIAAPPLPVLLSSEPTMGAGYLGITRAVALTFDFEGIVIGDMGELGDIATIDALLDQGDVNLAVLGAPDLPTILWASGEKTVWAGISDCGVWPRDASDSELSRFGVLDLAGNFSGWTEVALELPSVADAEAAADADLEARRTHNIQQGRPSACSLGLAGGDGAGSGERARAEWFALGVGLVAAGVRRARRSR